MGVLHLPSPGLRLLIRSGGHGKQRRIRGIARAVLQIKQAIESRAGAAPAYAGALSPTYYMPMAPRGVNALSITATGICTKEMVSGGALKTAVAKKKLPEAKYTSRP